jgi:hypothetical protein
VRELFPSVNDVKIDRPRDPGQRPVVWLGYVSHDECEEAMAAGENLFSGGCRLCCVSKTLDQKQAFARLNQKAKEYQTRNTIYMASIPKAATRETVIAACAEFGNLNACVVISPPGKATFAFAAFESPDAYRRALQVGINLGYKDRTRVVPSKTST